MNRLLLATALAALLLGGCALMGGGGDDEALVRCQAEADRQYKARYTDKWNRAVDQCLRESRTR
ncbi:hypothetical protein [Desulfocurvus sp. DL9XJH121]